MSEPTATERLLFGDEGCDNPWNPFRLERDLIPPEQWESMLDLMPPKCQAVVYRDEFLPIGIGFNNTVGWFTILGGMGMYQVWSQIPDPSKPVPQADGPEEAALHDREYKAYDPDEDVGYLKGGQVDFV